MLLTAEKLVADVGDIYSLGYDDLIGLEGFADLSVRNLLEAVQASKQRPIARLLVALLVRPFPERMGRVAVGEGRPEDVGAPLPLGEAVGARVHHHQRRLLGDHVRPERIRHRRGDDAAQQVDLVVLHQLPRLGQAFVGLGAGLGLEDQLDGAAPGLVADLAPVEQEPVAQIDAELSQRPLIGIDEADLDRAGRLSRGRRSRRQPARGHQHHERGQHAEGDAPHRQHRHDRPPAAAFDRPHRKGSRRPPRAALTVGPPWIA